MSNISMDLAGLNGIPTQEGWQMLKLSELKNLPFSTLAKMAHAVACDIDRGETDKRELLERIFKAMR